MKKNGKKKQNRMPIKSDWHTICNWLCTIDKRSNFFVMRIGHERNKKNPSNDKSHSGLKNRNIRACKQNLISKHSKYSYQSIKNVWIKSKWYGRSIARKPSYLWAFFFLLLFIHVLLNSNLVYTPNRDYSFTCSKKKNKPMKKMRELNTEGGKIATSFNNWLIIPSPPAKK